MALVCKKGKELNRMSEELLIPGTKEVLRPGYLVKLSRFDTVFWEVGYGWYSVAENRPVFGWYLSNTSTRETKALQSIDLVDIYVVEIVHQQIENPPRSVESINDELIDGRKIADKEYESIGELIRQELGALQERVKYLEDKLNG